MQQVRSAARALPPAPDPQQGQLEAAIRNGQDPHSLTRSRAQTPGQALPESRAQTEPGASEFVRRQNRPGEARIGAADYASQAFRHGKQAWRHEPRNLFFGFRKELNDRFILLFQLDGKVIHRAFHIFHRGRNFRAMLGFFFGKSLA